jgi:hypothetical protein
VSQTIGARKVTLTAIWGIAGSPVVDMMPSGACFNTKYFLTHIWILCWESLFRGKDRLCTSSECPPGQFLDASKQAVDENALVTVAHSPYNPDLAPSNFWCFGHIKTCLAGNAFNDVDELLEAVIEFLNEIQPCEWRAVSHHWIEHVKWV